MARASSNSTSEPKRSSRRAASPKEKSARKGRSSKASSRAVDQHVSDEAALFGRRTRREIGAIVLIVLAVVLMIMVASPNDAIVTAAVSGALRMCLGVAAYVLPVFMLGIGVVLLVRVNSSLLPARMAIGLLVIYIAVLGILGLTSFGAEAGSTQFLFTSETLLQKGGYVGAAIAWAGLTLFGQTISIVFMVGLIAIGLAIIGLSASKIYESVRDKAASRADDPDRVPLGVKLRSRGRSSQRVQKAGDEPASSQDSGFVPVFDAQSTRAIPVSSAEFGKQETRLIGSDKSPKRKDKGVRIERVDEPAARGRLANAETVALSGTEKPLTRVLGAKPDKAKSEKAKPAAAKKRPAAKKADVSTPSPDADFVLPPMDFLAKSGKAKGGATEEELAETGALLQETLGDFGILAQVVGWVAGPTVTLFKVNLPAGVRVSRITALNNDIALALAAPGVRIFAPIPGTNYVGIEVPNKSRQTVFLSDVLTAAKPGPLQIAIGKDVEGNSIVSDLAKMPHLLIGGTTGSGKSVSINAMIMSILMRATPSEVRFIMIDPKRVEFTPYNGIPHLYVPVVTEPKEAASALSWGVAEMERRLKEFAKVGARNIGQYNAKAQAGPVDGEDLAELPYIVIIIDELADLMMNVGKEVEFSISRIAQLARAAGIHLIVATQRPSAKVVTGLIKANITNRIAFNVASGIDSRVILDTPGAENLIGLGDLLLSKPELSKPQRIQGCFVSEDEINAVVEHLKDQGSPEYHTEILKTNLVSLGDTAPDGSGGTCDDDDPLIWEAAEIVVSSKLGSTSNLQRRLKVGYARAGRIMDMLEEKGVVGPANGSKPRDVLVDEMELETLKAFESND